MPQPFARRRFETTYLRKTGQNKSCISRLHPNVGMIPLIRETMISIQKIAGLPRFTYRIFRTATWDLCPSLIDYLHLAFYSPHEESQ